LTKGLLELVEPNQGEKRKKTNATTSIAIASPESSQHIHFVFLFSWFACDCHPEKSGGKLCVRFGVV
jgi:hypothetical protein